ncbi:hypothetical protein MTO96_025340 [Rhipicephalus appendiculatus]
MSSQMSLRARNRTVNSYDDYHDYDFSNFTASVRGRPDVMSSAAGNASDVVHAYTMVTYFSTAIRPHARAERQIPRVSQDPRPLLIVDPLELLDSPEWFGLCGSGGDKFQVTVTAMDRCRVVVWNRDKLKLTISGDTFLQAVFDDV